MPFGHRTRVLSFHVTKTGVRPSASNGLSPTPLRAPGEPVLYFSACPTSQSLRAGAWGRFSRPDPALSRKQQTTNTAGWLCGLRDLRGLLGTFTRRKRAISSANSRSKRAKTNHANALNHATALIGPAVTRSRTARFCAVCDPVEAIIGRRLARSRPVTVLADIARNEQSKRRWRWLLGLWAECPGGVPLWAAHFRYSELPCIFLVPDFVVLRACQ